MNDQQESVIVTPQGRPAREALKKSDRCPGSGCGKGPEKRVASGGFGARHPVCSNCGYEFTDEVWVD